MQIVRGETKSFTLQIKDAAGALLSLADKRIYFTSRRTGAVVHDKRTENAGGSTAQIEVLGVGSAKLKFLPTDTSSLGACRLDCDVWVVKDDQTDFTRVLSFTLDVTEAQTRTFPIA